MDSSSFLHSDDGQVLTIINKTKDVVYSNEIIQTSGCREEIFQNQGKNMGHHRRPNEDVDLIDTIDKQICGGSVEHLAAKYLAATAGHTTTTRTPTKKARKQSMDVITVNSLNCTCTMYISPIKQCRRFYLLVYNFLSLYSFCFRT